MSDTGLTFPERLALRLAWEALYTAEEALVNRIIKLENEAAADSQNSNTAKALQTAQTDLAASVAARSRILDIKMRL